MLSIDFCCAVSSVICAIRLSCQFVLRARTSSAGIFSNGAIASAAAQTLGGGRHAEHHRTGLVLGVGSPAGAPDRQQPRRAILAHAGQHRGRRVSADGRRNRMEQHIDRSGASS